MPHILFSLLDRAGILAPRWKPRYPGVFVPSRNIATALSIWFIRVSSFLASVIQRQYSFPCVEHSFPPPKSLIRLQSSLELRWNVKDSFGLVFPYDDVDHIPRPFTDLLANALQDTEHVA